MGFKHTESCLLGYRESEAPRSVPGVDFGILLLALASFVGRPRIVFKLFFIILE